MNHPDPRPLRWANLDAELAERTARATELAERAAKFYARPYRVVPEVPAFVLAPVEQERATRARELLLCGMEARYHVRGGLQHTSVDTLDADVQQTLHDADLLDLWPDEAARLAAALIRGYAEANPVASPEDRAHDRRTRSRHRANAYRRVGAKIDRAVARARDEVQRLLEWHHGIGRQVSP